jgi:hypothetical protein
MGRPGGAAAEHLLAYLSELGLDKAPGLPVLRPDVEDADKYDNPEQR